MAFLRYNGKTLNAAKGSGVSIRYMKSTGTFSGSYKPDAVNANGRTKKKTVSFKGVFVDGVGYGTATIKGVGSWPVTIEKVAVSPLAHGRAF